MFHTRGTGREVGETGWWTGNKRTRGQRPAGADMSTRAGSESKDKLKASVLTERSRWGTTTMSILPIYTYRTIESPI